MPEDVEFEEIDSSVDLFEAAPLALTKAPTPRQSTVIEGDRLDEYRETMVAEGETAVGDLTKPWMKFHQFVLVKTVEHVRQIVDAMLEHGRGAIDLETEGLDNRIYYDEENKPYTVHKIVGFCLGYKGIGHYVPIRHKFDTFFGEKDPNVPAAGVEAEIRRLCQASQPILTEEGLQEDALASPKIAVPPKVVLYFWHAKFDQEFLYPITGIDFWHPASFEDGMLAAYTAFSDDDLGLKDKAFQRLQIEDPEAKIDGKPVRHPYEMIKFKELFSKTKSNKDMHFADLYPEEGSAVVKYACSDAICTEALCETKKVDWALTQPNLKVSYKEVLTAVADKKFAFTYRLEKQTAQASRVMERPRVKIDKKEIVALLARAEAERDKYSVLISTLAEKKGFVKFNSGSTKQLSDFLFSSEKGLDISPKPEKHAASGQYKTDAATLEKMSESPDAQEVLVWIVKYRQIDKIIGTYLTSMSTNCDANDELRFGFNQTGAATGRFTASAGMPEHGYSGIPIHGIPARSDPKKPEVSHSLRRAFVAREGYTLVKVDYAGQELRVVANLSGEKVWLDEFLNGTGDLHTITAKAFFGQHITKDDKTERNAGKIANFSLIYGGGTQAIMRATKCDKVEAARRKANFDKSVPTFAGWVKTQHVNVKKVKGVYTAFYRFIAIPDANVKTGDLDNKGNPILEADARKIQAACERKSTNYPIQGCNQAHSLVLCQGGLKKIGDLAKTSEEFTVWTGTQWARATAHNMGTHELAEVSLKDGTLIECDTRHKLLIVTDSGYSWVPYSKLEKGMAVATPLHEVLCFDQPVAYPRKKSNTKSSQTFNVPKDKKDLWYWIGRYIGDGCLNGGVLTYSFGSHESDAVNLCREFWHSCGVRTQFRTSKHTPHTKESTRHQVCVESTELYDWLLALGLTEGQIASTKRLPNRIFCESLSNRKALILGVLASDGCHPDLGAAKGNPYNVHLCQRPLLVDLKRLLRTVGVESVIRGPYRNFNQHLKTPETISYRLDIQRRMYDANVLGLCALRPKFVDMHAPQFMVDEFLTKGPFEKTSFNGDASLYSLYLRLKTGGKVTVYTLRDLCVRTGVQLSQPIYGFKRLVSKKALGRTEATYTLNVQDPLHRFESDGVITKNSGADIMKIAMVKLVKEFTKFGWLRHNGDDSVRMLMTVHDEIVFEIKHERLTQAVPVIIDIMQSPSTMVRWRVPLIVEPLISQTWEAKIDWHEVMAGKKANGDPVSVPKWLEGILKPGEAHVAPEAIVHHQAAPSALSLIALSGPTNPTKGTLPTYIFALNEAYLTKRSVDLVFEAIAASINPEGKVFLCLKDNQLNVLIDPIKRKIPINPQTFAMKLQDKNLGSGDYIYKEEPL